MKHKLKTNKTKLGQDQIEFITNKVMELGSIDEVCKFYNTDDSVCKFAIQLANETFKPKRIQLKKGK